jgi:hypothetical protein
MCWNAEVSLQSFGIGIVAILLGLYHGLSLPTALFCLTIVFMQLIEYIVWSNYADKKVNYLASLGAVFLLWLQPIASILTLPGSLRSSLLIPYLSLTGAGLLFGFSSSKDNLRMYRGTNGHLVWDWLQRDMKTYLSLIVYFVFLLLPLVLSQEFVLLGLSLLTLGASLFSFYDANTWGSMWCWIVNYLVVGVCGYQVFVSKP